MTQPQPGAGGAAGQDQAGQEIKPARRVGGARLGGQGGRRQKTLDNWLKPRTEGGKDNIMEECRRTSDRAAKQAGRQARGGAVAGTGGHPDHATNGHVEVGRTERWGIDIDWCWD